MLFFSEGKMENLLLTSEEELDINPANRFLSQEHKHSECPKQDKCSYRNEAHRKDYHSFSAYIQPA